MFLVTLFPQNTTGIHLADGISNFGPFKLTAYGKGRLLMTDQRVMARTSAEDVLSDG